MVVGRTNEPRTVTVTIPSATVTNKALTANVASLTTSSAHNFVVGEQVDVSGVDATFNGRYTISSVPSATTFTYSKTAADVVSVASGGVAISTGITAAAGTFEEEDAGRTISALGIPAGATVASVQSHAAARLSAAPTAAGSVSATLGVAKDAAIGFIGWSPETHTESETYTVAARNAGTVSPEIRQNAFTGNQQRARG